MPNSKSDGRRKGCRSSAAMCKYMCSAKGCGYVASGEVGMRLHKRLTHGVAYLGVNDIVNTDDAVVCRVCFARFSTEYESEKHLAETGHYRV